MNNCNFGAIVAGSIFLAMFSLICFGLSGIILAALNQFLGINLLFEYHNIPFGILILTTVFILVFLAFILKH